MKSFNTEIIAISNQKGGVGKTTTAINIASFLAVTETPTLLVDMDPQANASSGLGIDINEELAAKYPCQDEVIEWTQTRLPDGSPTRP